MSLDAMKQALEALELWCPASGHALNKRAEAVVALRAAIEQAQEPVAWMWADGTVTADPDRADGTWAPLYTSPRQWQELTEDDSPETL